MYEELIKRLRCLSRVARVESEPGVIRVTIPAMDAIREMAKEAADAIEELSRDVKSLEKILGTHPDPKGEPGEPGVPPSRWIPVTEEPPRKVGDDGYNGYLVWANGYYEVADYTIDKLDNVPYFHVDGEFAPDVTYYMPLPEPPKEDKL